MSSSNHVSVKVRADDHEVLTRIAAGMPGVTFMDLVTAARTALLSLPLRHQTAVIGRVVESAPSRGRPRGRGSLPEPDPTHATTAA